MNGFSDMQGSAVVAKPREMSIAADACKGQCQFNLHPLARQPSVNAQGIFLLWDSFIHHISSLNTRRRPIPQFQILQVVHFS